MSQQLDDASAACTPPAAQADLTPQAMHGAWRLSSAFQPIYSLSHMRLVGHEALLRAHDPVHARAVSPLEVFAACPDVSAQIELDHLSRLLHLQSHQQQCRNRAAPQDWLFLNAHPSAFKAGSRLLDDFAGGPLLARHGMAPGNVVVEVLESQSEPFEVLAQGCQALKAAGLLIALDDFGAGHSNFDRVWHLQPDIVKLDRSVIVQAMAQPQFRRPMAQLVSLLHECGALVLVEGVESPDEALLALDCDADLVQGYCFARPQAQLRAPGDCPPSLRALHDDFHHLHAQRRTRNKAFAAPYLNAIGHASVLLSVTRSLEEACRGFLQLPDVEMVYLLDANGYQLDQTLWAELAHGRADSRCTPLHNASGACWSRRPYFRRAMERPEKPRITGPYRTIAGTHQCLTVSTAFRMQGGADPVYRVICGDIRIGDTSDLP